MRISLCSCDHPSCQEVLSFWLSVDVSIQGWYITEDEKTFCPNHRGSAAIDRDEPFVSDMEINKRAVAMMLSHP